MRGLTLKCEWVGRGPLSLYWSGDPEIIGINSPSRPANFRPHQQQGCRGRTSDFELVIILEGRRGEERLILERRGRDDGEGDEAFGYSWGNHILW